jgi:hypothetical protein
MNSVNGHHVDVRFQLAPEPQPYTEREEEGYSVT